MEFGGHRRVVGHRLAGGRLAAPYIHGDPFGKNSLYNNFISISY